MSDNPVTKNHQPVTSTQMAKVPLDELGSFWAQGYDLRGDELVKVVTHFDPHTRTVIIEYITRRPAAPAPVQTVTARRRRPHGS